MGTAYWSRIRTAAVLSLVMCGPLASQQGAVAGRVTNAVTLEPVPGAEIRVVGQPAGASVSSEDDGTFELRLPGGVYDLVVEAPGFSPTRFDRIRVSGGQTTTRNLPLESRGYRLAGYIVTPSRLPETGRTLDTELTAASSSHSVSAREVSRRPTPSPVDHLRSAPGVDVGTLGLQSSNVVTRGFNNIFSGALHMMTDYRLAGLPALRVNYPHFLPLVGGDIERIEVVLGPGAALYGPNTANGVVHVITKSPLEAEGTTVSLAAGEQSVLHGTFRTARAVHEEFGFKVSGQFLRGREWPYVDSAEVAARRLADSLPEVCVEDRLIRGVSLEEATLACARVGTRDDEVRRLGLEARADWRFSDRGALIATYGVSSVTGIELTGLSAVQVDNWLSQYAQARFTYDRWAVQTYFNFNDSGDAFFLRDGLSLVDRSTLGVIQLQNGFGLANGRHDFTYGFDYFSTRPSSRGTIYGDYESDNDMSEWGLYLQARSALTSGLELTAVARVDHHSILESPVFSPRVALVWQPLEDHAIRVAYNEAFSTPTALNYFLDLGGGLATGLSPYSTRAFGTGRDGFALQNADGSLRGMRSPFNAGGAGVLLPADEATLWELGVGVLDAGGSLAEGQLDILQRLSPGAIGIEYLDTNDAGAGYRPLEGLRLPDVGSIQESSARTFEIGWTGLFDDALRVSIDAYRRTERNFVSPLTVVNPLLRLDALGLEGWLLDEYVPARVVDLVDREGLSNAEARSRAEAEAAELARTLDATPLAVASSDAPQLRGGGADLIATYRNVGDLNLWGFDASVQWFLGSRWEIAGTYSHVSEDWFELGESVPLALNAPRHKGTLGVVYRDEPRGFRASARIRYTDSFPFLSTEFDGTACRPGAAATAEPCIDAYALVDLTLGYQIPGTPTTVQLGVSNVLDESYRSFVGAPATGRMAMLRVTYDLF